MTLEKAKELLLVQAGFGGFYNRNSARLILAEVGRKHGQDAVDRLIRETGLDAIFGFAPGSHFEGVVVEPGRRPGANGGKAEK